MSELNWQAALTKVQANGLALEQCSAKQRDDNKIALAAVESNPHAIKYVSARLKNDREVVLAAVKQQGWLLMHASAELKNDYAVVQVAVQQDREALYYASDALQNNPALIQPTSRSQLLPHFISELMAKAPQIIIAGSSLSLAVLTLLALDQQPVLTSVTIGLLAGATTALMLLISGVPMGLTGGVTITAGAGLLAGAVTFTSLRPF